jgi:hypothetical protein
MKNSELAKQKEEALNYFQNVKLNGGRVLEYKCPCCNAELMSNVPTAKKDKWDSLVTCYECGDRFFYVKTYSKITTKKL